MISTSTITVTELLNFSKDIAQLNLGYLGISVVILGAFIYFNFKSLKSSLNKQETIINDLKEEADKLLEKAKEQSDNTLENFRKKQIEETSELLKEQFKKTTLEIENRYSKLEKFLLEKIESISENKNTKLKNIILSETISKISIAEKVINTDANKLKTDFDKKTSSMSTKIYLLEEKIFNLRRSLVDFEIEHYSKEGQVGAIGKMIEKLEMDIKKGWGEEDTIIEIKDYIVEKGMPSYYFDELSRVIKEMPAEKFKAISKEVLDLAQKKLYKP